ncbi:MAG: phosphatidylglycerol lysyltransferase domain-containing protein [Candidatus Omnitrophica bacterium]|nr:phosphatidylglycerol lysyltransferase domain-containing protein [Candidatus Omnitrophota bacterium]
MEQPHLKQYVPSSVCLSCDGCCRFKEQNSRWRPRVGLQEKTQLSLAEKIFATAVDEEGSLKTISCGGMHLCQFFNATDHTCGVYQNRPFECQLYPFLLTRWQGKVAICVHWNCPHVQKHFGSLEYQKYVQYLQDYFGQAEVKEFVEKNPGLIGDYGGYEAELEYLFNVETLDSAQPTGLLDQQLLVNSYLEKRPRFLSSLSFVSLFLWKDHFSFEFEEIDHNLCVFAKNQLGTFLYWPPLGEAISANAVKECFLRMDNQNQKISNGKRSFSHVGRIENVAHEAEIFKTFGYHVQSRGEELYYYRENLVDFKGEAYKSKRSSYNQFARNYPYRYLPYSSSMLEDCCQLYEDWMAERKSKSDNEIFLALLEENKNVHRLAFEYFQELGLVGRVVEVDGRIRAYTFGYPLTDQTFCILFEVADLSFKGLPTFIFREFCADPELQNFSFINVMEDFAMENVTKTKLSFHPTIQFPIYTITQPEHI